MPMSASNVKKRTRLIREVLGRTPAEIADEFGLPRSAWTQYESPKYKRTITLDVAVKLRDAYGISLDWLYLGDRLASLPAQIEAEIRKRGAA